MKILDTERSRPKEYILMGRMNREAKYMIFCVHCVYSPLLGDVIRIDSTG